MFKSVLALKSGDIITGDGTERYTKELRVASVAKLHADSPLDPTWEVKVRPANNPQGGVTTWACHANCRFQTR